MGQYMTVVLKEQYQNEIFIEYLNMELATIYGATSGNKFNSWAYLNEQAHALNTDPDRLMEWPHQKRPLTSTDLHENFFGFRMGEYVLKISSEVGLDQARDAVAICKWIVKTKGKFINKHQSENYYPFVLREYLDDIFLESRFDLTLIWTMPK